MHQQSEHNIKGIKLSGSEDKLEQKNVEDSHKTLGTFKCLIGSETDHINFLQEKSNKISEKI
jgi:hypothetical protein